jgi:Fe-S cluster assembly protein SufD
MATVVLNDKDKFLLPFENQDFSFEPKDFIKIRELAISRLKDLDFPNNKLEDWKYTNVRSISKSLFKPQNFVNVDVKKVESNFIPNLDAYRLVFINGIFSEKYSSIQGIADESIVLTNLNHAKKNNTAVLAEYYNRVAVDPSSFFVNLSNAYAQDGAFIQVLKNTKVSKAIHILHLIEGDEVCSMPRNVVISEKNSEANIIISYASLNAENSFVNSVSEIFLMDGANLDLDIIQNENKSSANHINYIQAKVAKDANLSVNTIPVSGSLIRNNLNIKLLGKGANADLYAPIVINGDMHLDNQTYVEHIEPNCTSNELYKSVVNDRATNVFNGKILVAQAAQKTNAFQSNANIILTDDAKVNSKPQLEIYADDVKCSHGCTIGQFDEEALFYLQARGIKRSTAQKVLLDAFIGEVIDHIPSESLQEYARNLVQQNFKNIN